MATDETHRPEPAPRAGRARLALGAAAAVLLLLGVLGVVRGTAALSLRGSGVAGLDNGQIGLVCSVAVGALLVVGPLAGWVGDR